MKKFKRFLCIPLLVLFTMTLLTLPVAAAVKVLLPDNKPAASMTFNFSVRENSNSSKSTFFGPVQVTTDAAGTFPWPNGLEAAFESKRINSGFVFLTTNTPTKMNARGPINDKDIFYNSEVIFTLQAIQ